MPIVLVLIGTFQLIERLEGTESARHRRPAPRPPLWLPRVACSASSTRAFFSFISISVGRADFDQGDPRRKASQTRSWSFSLS